MPIMFEPIAGNEPIKSYLRKALQENRLPQTLLFSGPDGVGKGLFAKTLAIHLLKSDFRRIESGNHPDFHLVKPEGKSGLFSIDTLREMIGVGQSAPFESIAKVFILEDAERMQPAAANAILKTLEEPASDTTFILLSSAPQEMLPTILSRCVHLSFQPVPEDSIADLLDQKGLPRKYAKLSAGSVGRAVDLATLPQMEEQRIALFRLLSGRPSYPALSKQLEKFDEAIEEKKEEDPLRAHRQAESLFTNIFMWYRDQHLKRLTPHSESLFFPEEPAVDFPLQSLQTIESKLDEARSSYQRNIKLSVCLAQFFI